MGKSQSTAHKPGPKKITRPRPIDFAYGLKSFVGYLEGSGKSFHTIKNYRLDVLAFQEFLEGASGSAGRTSRLRLEDVGSRELEAFHSWLRAQGLKSNTRRRKLLTVGRFLAYLQKRDKVPDEAAHRILAPHKIERIPVVVDGVRLIDAIRALPAPTAIESRNRVLLWAMAEAGVLVSEVAKVRFDQWRDATPGEPASLEVTGKSARRVPISAALVQAARGLQTGAAGKSSAPWVFPGHNRHGALGAPISSRGVELLVRAVAAKLGFPDLTPRTFRHSAVIRWFGEGIDQKEIQRRLGLKTAYAFRSYLPIVKQT